MCENSFCQQANLDRHIKRHQQKYFRRGGASCGIGNIGIGSSDSVSTISQNDTALNETFSEEDEEDEVVDLETVSAD